MERGGRGGAAALAPPRPLARKAGTDRLPRDPNLRVLPAALPFRVPGPGENAPRCRAETRRLEFARVCAASLAGRGREGGRWGLGRSWSRAVLCSPRRGGERQPPEPPTPPKLEPPLPPSLPPSLLPGARTRPPRPYSTPFPRPTPILSLCVRALNNFILFGKRNNAPDFTRGKQQAEQNKEQM